MIDISNDSIKDEESAKQKFSSNFSINYVFFFKEEKTSGHEILYFDRRHTEQPTQHLGTGFLQVQKYISHGSDRAKV